MAWGTPDPKGQAPWDAKGNLLSYPQGVHEWRPVSSFTTHLTLDHVTRGRSSVVFVWKDSDGHSYPMFVSDLEELITKTMVAYGETLTCTWTIKKKGQNYGIALARD